MPRSEVPRVSRPSGVEVLTYRETQSPQSARALLGSAYLVKLLLQIWVEGVISNKKTAAAGATTHTHRFNFLRCKTTNEKRNEN